MTRGNISKFMNEGVNIICKAVTNQFFTVLGLIVELVTDILKSNGDLEASTPNMQIYVTVTYNSPVIYSILFI